MTATSTQHPTATPSVATDQPDTEEPAIDQDALNAFLAQIMGDLGASLHVLTVVIGDKLGLFRALAETGPSTSVELATATGTAERYVSLSQDVGAALGAQARPAAIKDAVRRAGFQHFAQVARTPFNRVFEARLS